VDLCPKSELQEQRGLTLHTLASRLQKQEARFNPCNSIGYFIFQYYVIFFTFRFFKFYLPSLLLHYKNTDLLASFLALFPATVLLASQYTSRWAVIWWGGSLVAWGWWPTCSFSV
jgi:hypothetical protein